MRDLSIKNRDNSTIKINRSQILKLVIAGIFFVGCGGGSKDDNLRKKFQNKEEIHIAIMGDSTTAGFGANPSINKWTNGLSYGCVNMPEHGLNWEKSSEYYINTSSYPSSQQENNLSIPSAVRLMKTYVMSENPTSNVYNFGIGGAIAKTHIDKDTINKLPENLDAVFINLGINTAKLNQTQYSDLKSLVRTLLAMGIEVILVKPNNIFVSSVSKKWEASSCPDDWVSMDNWLDIRNNIQKLADEYSLEVIDLGDDNNTLKEELLYDSFHPSNLGYVEIFNIYKNWLTSK